MTLMIEAVSSSEMSVSIYETTWNNIPEDSHLHTVKLNYHQMSLLHAVENK
jgi:hypothetical protein